MFSVKVDNLCKRFGSTRVLHDLSFTFQAGVLGIGGSNGTGKSTLLRCLAGLIRPTSGTISWKKNGAKLSTENFKNNLGYIAPYINLYHELTIRENMELILQLRKQTTDPNNIEQIWDLLALGGLQNKHFGDLSTGQQQRARIACTLSYAPSILFLDEPGANLDEQGRQAVERIIGQYRDENRMILLASNNPDELEWSDRILSVE